MADVLIVHDDLHVRGSLIGCVRRAGHTPHEALDVAEALRWRKGAEFVAAFISPWRYDIRARGLLHESFPDMRVVLVGSSAAIDVAREAKRAFEYVATPLESRTVTEVLGRVTSAADGSDRCDDDAGGGDSSRDAALVAEAEGAFRDEMAAALRDAGYAVLTASSAAAALHLLETEAISIALVGLAVAGPSSYELAQRLARRSPSLPVVLLSAHVTLHEALAAHRLGAFDVLQTPVAPSTLLATVERARRERCRARESQGVLRPRDLECEAHAAARWARALVPTIDSPRDPRTIAGWSRWIAASQGAIRNWCRTAGIRPRHSLMFARMLRATVIAEQSRQSPQNALDIVDGRTLIKLMKLAGFAGERELPATVPEFLDRQVLIRDAHALGEVKRALDERHPERWNLAERRRGADDTVPPRVTTARPPLPRAAPHRSSPRPS